MFLYAKHIQFFCRKEPRQCRAWIAETIANRWIICLKEMIEYFILLAYSVKFLDT